MKHILFIIALLPLTLTAQNLPTAGRNSAATIIYRLSHADVRALNLKGKPVTESMLHTLITSYTGNKIPDLERGNYLMARAENGRMHYWEHIEDNFLKAEILSGAKPDIILIDTLNGVITDARISGWKYSPQSNTYTTSTPRYDKIYEINNEGVYRYITLYKEYGWRAERPSWLSRQWSAIKGWFKKHPDVYDGFVTFSKPKYRPNDTVRLKSYLTMNDKLYDKAVDLVLSRPSDIGGDTVLTHLSPYRAGMYEYEFKLSDKLKLRLDDYYTLSLRAADETHLLGDYFRYEEYELKSLKFTAVMSKSDYLAADSVEINLTAVDENGLGIYDGRVEITVTSQDWNGGTPLAHQIFVPDTLWTQTIDMQGFSNKTVTIPNTVFPANYTGSFYVACNFMTADNERKSHNSYFIRNGNFNYQKPKETSVPSASFVRNDGKIELIFVNTDSLPLWYSVYCGDKIIDRGFGRSVERTYQASDKAYTLRYWYWLDDEVRSNSNSLPYLRENITMSIAAPKNIYPGQEVTIGVDVVDKKGRAVENADVTAYSYTSKFENSGNIRPVNLRFNGVRDYTIPQNSYFEVYEEQYNSTLKMDWNIWRERLGLDSLEFYRFLNPKPVYKYAEKTDGKMSIIMPFAVVNGEAVGVQVLYIDEQPCYLRAAEQRENYAFKVRAGYHALRMRLPDVEVSYYLTVEEGEKLIISLDCSASNPENGIYVSSFAKKQRGALTNAEHSYLDKYMAYITVAAPMTQIYRNNVVEPLYIKTAPFDRVIDLTDRNSRVLVGPFPYNNSLYNRLVLSRTDEEQVNWFELYGVSVDYRIDNHQVMVLPRKKSALPKRLNSYCPSFDFAANPLTVTLLNNEFEQRIRAVMVSRSGAADRHTDTITRNTDGCRLSLSFGRETGKKEYLQVMLLQFAYPTDTLRYYGSTRTFARLPEGEMTFTAVMVDGREYTTVLNLKKGGRNWALIDNVELALSDGKIYNDVRKESSKSMAGVNFSYNDYDKFENVAAVGYGNSVRRNMTGAVYDAAPMMKSEMAFEEALSGQTAGIMVRGVSSLSESTNALIIVDGKVFEGDLASINTGDITSMEVLKDESAMAIYGARAANGVMIITTKKGSSDDSTEQYSAASIRHNFSDDAFWQPHLTTDKNGHASFTTVFPDDITQWLATFIAVGTPKQTAQQTVRLNSYLPLSARLSVPNFALRGDRFNAIGKLTSYSDDTVTVRTSLGELTFAKSYSVGIETVAEGTDSLTMEYSLVRNDGFSDGERRVVPIYPVGTTETKGEFIVLENGGNHTFSADNEHVPITLHAEATQLGSLIGEIERTVGYVYNCNEQMASKIKSLVSKRQIYNALGRPFEESGEIVKLVEQILKNRNKDGFWGWWGVSDSEWWLSEHIIEALYMAREAGYTVKWDIAQMTRTLMLTLQTGDTSLTDRVLVMLCQIGAAVDYATLFEALPELPKEPTVNAVLGRMLTKATVGLTTQNDADAVVKMAAETMFGGLAWEEKQVAEKRYYTPLPEQTTVENTLTAYKILQKIDNSEATRKKIRLYLFEQRRVEGWGNTYSTSRIVETILPDLTVGITSEYNKILKAPVLTVNNESVTKFPYEAKFAGGETLDVSYEGSTPLYITAYQQTWNPAPEAVSADFTVTSKFIQQGKQVTSLTAGEPVQLVVTVRPRANASYVMIDVPIPAGCSYEYHTKNWGEIHREYFKERTAIFVRSMSVGEYTYTINLIPRYTGVYTLNPARAELMYFPSFFGRTSVSQIELNTK